MKKLSGLRIKTYFVQSVAEAMTQAQQELGPQALLLNTQRLTEASNPARYEVTIGVNEEFVAAQQAAVESLPTAAGPLSLSTEELPASAMRLPPEFPSDEWKRLTSQMNEIQDLLRRYTRSNDPVSRCIPELDQVYSNLIAGYVDPLLAKDIVDGMEASVAADTLFVNSENLEKALQLAFERRVRISPTLGLMVSGTMRPATILVGPPGGGKTTTAAKIAISASSQKWPVRLLCLDQSRPGAAAQLQLLATAPGVVFGNVPTLERLPEVVAKDRQNNFVLVDTAGFATGNWQLAEALAATVANCPQVDVHLVVPAYINAADFRRVIERYRIFSPTKLLVTKTDEAETIGVAVSEAAREGLALSFVTNGPSVPQDIRPIVASDLTALGLHLRGSNAKRAA